MKYKYLIWNETTDNTDEVIFTAVDDDNARVYAKAQDDAQLNEEGEAYIYRENTPTSTFGCGHVRCDACDGWVDIDETPTIHGEPIK